MLTTVDKAYYRDLAMKCALVICLGAIATGLALYFFIYREPGASYAESYNIMATLRREILHISTWIYVATSVFIAAGIVVISLLYSHRIAGPVYRLAVFARQIASGDLGGTVKLRRNDVITMMADDLNELNAAYRGNVDRLEEKTRELKDIAAAIGGSKDGPSRDATLRLAAKRDEIGKILSNIKL